MRIQRIALLVCVLVMASMWGRCAFASCFYSGGTTVGDVHVSLPSTIHFARDVDFQFAHISQPELAPHGPKAGYDDGDIRFGVVNARGKTPDVSSPSFPIGNTGLYWAWEFVGVGSYFFTSQLPAISVALEKGFGLDLGPGPHRLYIKRLGVVPLVP